MWPSQNNCRTRMTRMSTCELIIFCDFLCGSLSSSNSKSINDFAIASSASLLPEAPSPPSPLLRFSFSGYLNVVACIGLLLLLPSTESGTVTEAKTAAAPPPTPLAPADAFIMDFFRSRPYIMDCVPGPDESSMLSRISF